MEKILDNRLNISFYPDFLEPDIIKDLYNILDKLEWKNLKKRSNLTFGNPGLIYVINFKDNRVERPTLPWILILLELKEYLEILTKQIYTVCVIQRYPTGKTKIKSHQDKEMKPGTLICGISIGQERILRMKRYNKKIDISLPSGSLYIFNPPTNDYWSHSIIPDNSVNVRYSLTFRNY